MLVQVHPVGSFPLAHQGDKKGATLLHIPIIPFQMALLVCGLTAAPCHYLYEHTQSCSGVTQAVSFAPRFIHSTQRWSRLGGNIQVLTLPLSTKIPDRAVPHTFVQPFDCLMSNPSATCSRTPPAGRKFTPASTSETRRKSSAGPETPPLVPFLRVGPWLHTSRL